MIIKRMYAKASKITSSLFALNGPSTISRRRNSPFLKMKHWATKSTDKLWMFLSITKVEPSPMYHSEDGKMGQGSTSDLTLFGRMIDMQMWPNNKSMLLRKESKREGKPIRSSIEHKFHVTTEDSKFLQKKYLFIQFDPKFEKYFIKYAITSMKHHLCSYGGICQPIFS